MIKPTKSIDVLIDEDGTELQFIIVDKGKALGSDNKPVTLVGKGGIYENDKYTGAPGQVQYFRKILWKFS